MQTMRVVLTTILLGLFGLARPFVNCSAPPGASLDIRTEDQLNMSNSISTLLLRNLSDVFGENDPVRRRAAIHAIFHEDAVFYDPKGGVFRGRDEIGRIAGELRATHLDFRYQPIAEAEETGNSGRVRWVEGRRGGILVVTKQLRKRRVPQVATLTERLSWLTSSLSRCLKALDLGAKPKPRCLADIPEPTPAEAAVKSAV